MAAIAVADFTRIAYNQEGEIQTIFMESPVTMDSADTVDVTSLLNGKVVINVQAWDASAANGSTTVTATIASTDVITVDAGGGTTNSTYIIEIKTWANVATS